MVIIFAPLYEVIMCNEEGTFSCIINNIRIIPALTVTCLFCLPKLAEFVVKLVWRTQAAAIQSQKIPRGSVLFNTKVGVLWRIQAGLEPVYHYHLELFPRKVQPFRTCTYRRGNKLVINWRMPQNRCGCLKGTPSLMNANMIGQ